jgi:hypothetical protein
LIAAILTGPIAITTSNASTFSIKYPSTTSLTIPGPTFVVALALLICNAAKSILSSSTAPPFSNAWSSVATHSILKPGSSPWSSRARERLVGRPRWAAEDADRADAGEDSGVDSRERMESEPEESERARWEVVRASWRRSLLGGCSNGFSESDRVDSASESSSSTRESEGQRKPMLPLPREAMREAAQISKRG